MEKMAMMTAKSLMTCRTFAGKNRRFLKSFSTVEMRKVPANRMNDIWNMGDAYGELKQSPAMIPFEVCGVMVEINQQTTQAEVSNLPCKKFHWTSHTAQLSQPCCYESRRQVDKSMHPQGLCSQLQKRFQSPACRKRKLNLILQRPHQSFTL